MPRVSRAKLSDIADREWAAKRGANSETLSLDAILDGLDGSDGQNPRLLGALTDERLDRQPEAAVEGRVLRDRIREVLLQLSPRQRDLVQGLLSDRTMSDIGRRLRIARPTLYDELQRVRDIFHDAGLEEFLA
jgi:RNA polymerase sigma-70 factor, ECF subfamily